MKKLMFFVILSFPPIANAGWFDKETAPKCSDSDTQELVIQISREKMEERLGKKTANSVALTLSSIRTTDFNEKTGSQVCAAELVMKNGDASASIDLTYTSELMDNGDEFYVSVYGL